MPRVCAADGGEQERRPIDLDPGADQILEMGELGPDKIGEIDAPPFILDEQILCGGHRADALAKAGDEIVGTRGRRLPRHGLHKGEEVLGAMVHFMQEQLDMLLIALALGDVGYKGDDVGWLASGVFQKGDVLVHPNGLCRSWRQSG